MQVSAAQVMEGVLGDRLSKQDLPEPPAQPGPAAAADVKAWEAEAKLAE